MEPITAILISLIASAVSGAGVVAALQRFIRIILSPDERAGRSFRQIITDAIKGEPETAQPEPTVEERIQELSDVMAQSVLLLKQITAEIDLRAAFAKQKKEEAEIAIAAASMNQEQLNALKSVVRTEVSHEGNRGIRAGLVVALCSFILGIVGTILVTLFIHPHESAPISPSQNRSPATRAYYYQTPTHTSIPSAVRCSFGDLRIEMRGMVASLWRLGRLY